jgi:DNA polymerase III subunit gamma/tau
MAKAKSEYTVVARRYRPQQFAELIGQEAVAQALSNALKSDRVAHAYLFTGARGVGKTSAARILAKALNCEKGPAPTPCDKCTSCVAIAAGDDIDVREIDGASNRGIDEIRAIRQDVTTRPARGRYKIYIIDEVHMLTKESFNALLKTLEEPPPHVKFIFATTEVQKVPITILSRCQRFDFGMIGIERIAKQLRAVVQAEKVKAEDEALEIIARRAAGSMRDAQSLLDQMMAFGGDGLTGEAVQKLLGIAGPERVMKLAEAVAARDSKLALERLAELADAGLQLGELLDQLIDYWRDLMLVVCLGKEAKDLNTPARFRDALIKQAGLMNVDSVMAGLDILLVTKNRLRGSGQIQTLLQMALIRLSRLDDLAQVSQLALWLSQPGSGPSAAAAPVTSRPTLTLPPEGKKKSDGGEIPADLTAETLPGIWPEILAQSGVMLSGQLQRAGLPAIFGPNALVLSFPSEYNAAYQNCSNPMNLERLHEAIRQRTGQAWKVRLEYRATPANGPQRNGVHVPVPKVRPQEIMTQFPLLQRAMEQLGALPMFIDPGFGAEPTPVPKTEEAPAKDNEET